MDKMMECYFKGYHCANIPTYTPVRGTELIDVRSPEKNQGKVREYQSMQLVKMSVPGLNQGHSFKWSHWRKLTLLADYLSKN